MTKVYGIFLYACVCAYLLIKGKTIKRERERWESLCVCLRYIFALTLNANYIPCGMDENDFLCGIIKSRGCQSTWKPVWNRGKGDR